MKEISDRRDNAAFFAGGQNTRDLNALASMVEEQHRIIDARLHRTARWRGVTRREVHGHAQEGDHARYEKAYNSLIGGTMAFAKQAIDASMLCEIHAAAVGSGEFRKAALRVGGHHNFPAASEVPSLVEAALARAASHREPIATAATRLHLNLIAIHPFTDGNGRTARLAAALMLARTGFRSTLLVAVEQHFHPDPQEYLKTLDRFQFGEIDEDACVAYLMGGMVGNGMYATWFRARESRLRAACARAGLAGTAAERTLSVYDLDPVPPAYTAAFTKLVHSRETPLHILIPALTAFERTEMSFQIQRLLDEESDQHQAKTVREIE